MAFYTLGCKVNQYESEMLKGLFSQNGYDVVNPEEEADVFVVNSCTVTAVGDKKTRQAIRHFKRSYPDAVVALTGCVPQAFPETADLLPEADIITGSTNRRQLVELVEQFLIERQRIISIEPHQRQEPFEPMRIERFQEHARAFIKIEDGCDRYCSYCIIPYARGPVRSKPLCELETELNVLAYNGYQEVVLVGINLSSYGRDLEQVRLVDAVRLACSVDGLKRVRLGSLEPELLTDEDIAAMASLPKFCDQFHLSLQSGCDQTLKRMNRHYDTAAYRRIVQTIRSSFANPAITTDVMVGFPGETEEEFQQSLDFVAEIGFARTHIFPYSARAGTSAAGRHGQIPRHLKAERAAKMSQQTRQDTFAFCQTQVGRTVEVLWEQYHTGWVQGYTKNYTLVKAPGEQILCGKILPVRLTEASQDGCFGTIESV